VQPLTRKLCSVSSETKSMHPKLQKGCSDTKVQTRKLQIAKSSCRKLSFRRKCFHNDSFEHFGSLAQGLGPNSIQHLIPDTISTHIQGPKMLKLGCLSQPLRISTASLLKGTFSRNVSNRTLSHILFESEYFLVYCFADGHFLTYCLA
jgi:hypothetical protein